MRWRLAPSKATILFEREAQIKSIKWTDLKTLTESLTNRNMSTCPTAQHVIKDLNAKLKKLIFWCNF